MTVLTLSQYQVDELRECFLRDSLDIDNIQKIGVIQETGDLIIEYEHVGSYPALNKGMETIKIPKQRSDEHP